MFKPLFLILLLSTLCWCVQPPRAAVCYLQRDPDSKENVQGFVSFIQADPDADVQIEINLYAFEYLSVGKTKLHGLHIHEYGDILGGCGSAGSHYNPTGAKHGAPSDIERHVGDLGNIEQDYQCIAFHQRTDRVVSLFGEHSIVGRAIVVHDKVDDLGVLGDPGSLATGNAGSRLACCVIGLGRAP